MQRKRITTTRPYQALPWLESCGTSWDQPLPSINRAFCCAPALQKVQRWRIDRDWRACWRSKAAGGKSGLSDFLWWMRTQDLKTRIDETFETCETPWLVRLVCHWTPARIVSDTLFRRLHSWRCLDIRWCVCMALKLETACICFLSVRTLRRKVAAHFILQAKCSAMSQSDEKWISFFNRPGM